MTNTQMLREKISASGFKMQYVAQECGLTYQGFLKKLNNESEFKASEMKALRTLLGLTPVESEAIFFCG